MDINKKTTLNSIDNNKNNYYNDCHKFKIFTSTIDQKVQKTYLSGDVMKI